MHLLKTVISPVFLIITFFASGIMLLFLKKKSKLAKWFLGIAFTIFFLLSFRPFSNYLLWGLERKYPPIFNFNEIKDINYIVVLTAFDSNNNTVPYTSNLGYRSGHRILEAHRIYTHMPHCKIIISGSKTGTHIMGKLLYLLGVPESKIIVDHSKNTYNSAVSLKNVLSEKQFILVTNAIHLPRAMSSFINNGFNPVPAPADFYYGYYKEFKIPHNRPLEYYIPNYDSFWRSNLAIYEYMGIFKYSIQRRI